MAFLVMIFGKMVTIRDYEVDEDLENYFAVVDDHDKNWSVKEEENCRNVLNMRIMDEHTFNQFKTAKKGKGEMKGVHSYDILANPLYLDDF